MSEIVRVPEKPFKRYWVVKVYDSELPNREIFTVIVPSWCKPDILQCQFPPDLVVCSKVQARVVAMKPALPDWISYDYIFFSQTDDIKSAYRRVDRLRIGSGGLLEESEQQIKRISRPNQKYQEDYEIGEPSSSKTTSVNSHLNKQVEKSKNCADKGKSLKKSLEASNPPVSATSSGGSNSTAVLLPDLSAAKDIFNREDQLPEKEKGSKSERELRKSLDSHPGTESINCRGKKQPSSKTTSAAIVLTPAQMSMLLLKMDQRSKRTEKMVKELVNERAISSNPTSATLQLLEESLPAMPFSEWTNLLSFEEHISSPDGSSAKQALMNFLKLVPGITTNASAKNMLSALISVPLSKICTFKGTSMIRDTHIEKHKFKPSCPTIFSCISEICFHRHGSAFDANHFTMAMQRFFAGSGDKNGGLEKRKNKSKEKIFEKEPENNSSLERDGKTNGEQRKRKEVFESSSSEESDNFSKGSRKGRNKKKSFMSSSSDVGESGSTRSGNCTPSCDSD